MRNFSMSVVAVALCAIAAATTVSAQDDPTNPPSWAGHKKAFIPEEYEWRNDTTLWFKGWFGNRPQWRFSNASLKADGWSAAVNVTTGLIRDGGWHREEYHVNQTLVHGNEEEGQLAYYALGYADGYSIGQRLWNGYKVNCAAGWQAYFVTNLRVNRTKANQWYAQFFIDQFAWTKKFAQGNSHYARHIKRQLAMLEGRAAGFNKRVADGLAGTMPRIENGPIETFTQFKMFFFASAIDRMLLPDFAKFKSEGNPWEDYNLWWPAKTPFVSPTTNVSALPRRTPKTHCTCGVKLTHDDLFAGRGTELDYSNMNNSITTITVESQVTMVRQQEGLASLEDYYMTSNKMFLCSVSNVIPDPRFRKDTSSESLTTPFPSLYLAIFAANTDQFREMAGQHNGMQPTTWFAVDFKKFVPAANGKNATLLPKAVVAVDVYPGNLALAEEVTHNLTAGRAIVANNRAATRQSYSYFKTPCEWCWLTGRSVSATPTEYPELAENATTHEEFFRLTRYNRWKTDNHSILPAPFTERRCAGLAVSVRYDLNTYYMNYTWGTTQCMSIDIGVIDSTAVSAKAWLGNLKSDDEPVTGYPMYAILSPTYENPDTPPYQPSEVALTQSALYWYPPVDFKMPMATRVAPHSGVTGATIGATDRSNATATVVAIALLAFGAGCLVILVRSNRNSHGPSTQKDEELAETISERAPLR